MFRAIRLARVLDRNQGGQTDMADIRDFIEKHKKEIYKTARANMPHDVQGNALLTEGDELFRDDVWEEDVVKYNLTTGEAKS